MRYPRTTSVDHRQRKAAAKINIYVRMYVELGAISTFGSRGGGTNNELKDWSFADKCGWGDKGDPDTYKFGA